MKRWGMLALLVVLLSSLGLAPAEAKNRPEDLFSKTGISKITITVKEGDAQKLVSAPKVSVPAKFAITGPNGSFKFANLPIGFHLKGTSTLRQNPSLISSRPSLRVKFKLDGFFKLPFLGELHSLTLNSMTQDESKIHEYSSYLLYNAVGIPAPRVGYAQVNVVVGGRTYQKGLFAIIEPYDDAFLDRRFPDFTQHLYEPCGHWTDVTRPGATRGGEDCRNSLFEVKEGWRSTPNKNDLRALASIQKITDNGKWWSAMNRYTDREKVIRFWATENFISAWDSYSGSIINNYYLRSNSVGKFSMMPTGTDEAFEYNFPMDARSIGYPLIYDDFKVQSKNRGSMFTRCLRVKACLNEYLDQLKFVSDTAGTMVLKKEMATIASMLAPYNAASVWAQTSAQNWVDMKRGEVRKLLQKYGR